MGAAAAACDHPRMRRRLASTADRAVIGRLAQLQGGCVARWQLVWLGLTDTTITRIARREGWASMHRGVRRLPGVADAPWARIWAAVLALSHQEGRSVADACLEPGVDPVDAVHNAARQRAVVTAMTAAWIRGLTSTVPPVPQVLLGTGHHPHRSGIKVVRGLVLPHHWTWAQGVAAADWHRLMWDAARIMRHRPGAADIVHDLIITADRLRVCTVDDVISLLDEPAQFDLLGPPPRVLREAVEMVRPGFSHSDTEALARTIITEQATALGLTVEPRPHKIRVGRRVIAEADVAVLALRHDVEIDGPHHDLRRQQVRDQRRDALMAEIIWTVTRFRVATIDADRDAFKRMVRADLQRRLDEAA